MPEFELNKSCALAFSKEWKNEVSEDAEAKSFRDDFFVPCRVYVIRKV